MSIQITESVILTRKSGEEIVVGKDEQVRPNNTQTITCDGPRCAIHHDTILPVTVVVNEDQVAKDPDALPEAYPRFIRNQPYSMESEIHEFCSPRCQADWYLTEYVPPLSPRQKAERMKSSTQLQAEKILSGQSGAISTPAAYQTQAITQADGVAL